MAKRLRRPALFPSEWVHSTLSVVAFRRFGHFASMFLAVVAACLMVAQVLAMSQRNEVLGAIVVLNPVDVMTVLVGSEQAPEFFFKHDTMLKDVPIESVFAARVRMIRFVDVDVAGYDTPSSEPPMVSAEFFYAMSPNEWARMSLEQPLCDPSLVRDVCRASAPAFAYAARDFGLARYVTLSQQVNGITGA